MNKQETIQIITLLAGNYNSIAEKDSTQKQMMVTTWYECLNDLDYNLVLQSVKKTIIESQYPPTIHEIRKNAIEIVKPTTKRSGIEAWNEAYKMICNGTYMTEEQFNMASSEIKKFFGNVNQVRTYATNTDFNFDVVRSNFLKQYDTIIQGEKQDKLLPEKMQNIIQQFVNKTEIKQLS